MYRFITIFICFLLLSLICNANSDDQGYFDYTETSFITVYTPDEDGARFLSHPFAEGLPDTGKRFYQLILPYVLQLEEITFPLPEPSYYFDFLSDNGMKRFSTGEGWIATDGQVAFTSDSDWKAIERIIRLRVDHIEPEKIDKSTIAKIHSNLAKSNGITKGIEEQSLSDAIDRLGPYTDKQDAESPNNIDDIVNEEKSHTKPTSDLSAESESDIQIVNSSKHSSSNPGKAETKNVVTNKFPSAAFEAKTDDVNSSSDDKDIKTNSSIHRQQIGTKIFLFIAFFAFFVLLIILLKRRA